MYNFCTKCGKENRSETGICPDCSTQAQPQIKTEKQSLPFAEPPPNKEFFENQTRPLGQTQQTSQIQPFHTGQAVEQPSQCPHCGGAGGIFPREEISTAGFIYLAIMIALTVFFFMIFFPCAIVPFGLVFLVFLFKEKHFACVNCGRRVN